MHYAFASVALNRYLVPDTGNKPKRDVFTRAFRKLFMHGNKIYERAEPGENEDRTRLYHPIWTPHIQLGDFGLGGNPTELQHF